ncbi:hypothetical protein HOT15_gp02 [Dickeya phage Dagda]|uniref:Serine/threonine kinase n=2 Tax=Aarhusvirus dagda TaxID=2732762 RepID=A0A2S1GSN1_9CAUD|nr:hypothetical protein HOT15_gp02 [Dickeya phage Dagda]AWD92359.1 hypothetical protein [Dickeya phage Dagda]AXY81606.1 hypothetical protein [Dickeya phage Dagda_B1]
MTTLKRIGKGAFTTAYLNEATQRVTLHSCDPYKEAMAWGWFPESPLFPAVEYVELGVYEMDYMPATRGLKSALQPDQWDLYQSLRAAANEWRANMARNNWRHSDSFSLLHTALSESAAFGLFPEAVQTIKEAVDACANFGSDVGFEISPRNVRANSAGQLVLMDVFFSLNKLIEVRK